MRIFGWAVAALAIAVVLFLVSRTLGVVGSVTTTDNIILSYEYFHDANGQFEAKVSQIADQEKSLAAAAPDARERREIELNAIRQACRTLAREYNANSDKTNRSIFKGRTAPEKLDETRCEAAAPPA